MSHPDIYCLPAHKLRDQNPLHQVTGFLKYPRFMDCAVHASDKLESPYGNDYYVHLLRQYFHNYIGAVDGSFYSNRHGWLSEWNGDDPRLDESKLHPGVSFSS